MSKRLERVDPEDVRYDPAGSQLLDEVSGWKRLGCKRGKKLSGWLTRPARNTMSNWEQGLVLVRARVEHFHASEGCVYWESYSCQPRGE